MFYVLFLISSTLLFGADKSFLGVSQGYDLPLESESHGYIPSHVQLQPTRVNNMTLKKG